ncbi:MAG: hypothetical protein RL071_4371 [Pseudomonadota bacterium]|jgi:tetratricopeptide (TPR) repeat protein
MWTPADAKDKAEEAREKVGGVIERGVEEAGALFDRLRVPLDPAGLEATLRGLPERLRGLMDEGRYSKVRVRFRGKQLLPDLPLSAVLAGEVLAGLALPLGALLVNLGAGAFLDIELLHEGDELVALAQAKLADGDADEAEALLRAALRLRPTDEAAHFHLGVLLRISGRKAEAIVHLERAAAAGGPHARRAADALGRLRGPSAG